MSRLYGPCAPPATTHARQGPWLAARRCLCLCRMLSPEISWHVEHRLVRRCLKGLDAGQARQPSVQRVGGSAPGLSLQPNASREPFQPPGMSTVPAGAESLPPAVSPLLALTGVTAGSHDAAKRLGARLAAAVVLGRLCRRAAGSVNVLDGDRGGCIQEPARPACGASVERTVCAGSARQGILRTEE